MTSVQKDLKIKFINKNTDKLIPNAPFSVTVTDSKGNSEVWSDADMDGIIYKKDLVAGSYKVAVNAFTEKRYDDYTLPIGNQLIDVKKEIVYAKGDVSDEVKSESEIDVAVEDTKKNETVVESTLQDTVAWVDSTSTVNTYLEITKSTVPDPVTLVTNSKNFIRTAYSASITPGSQTMAIGDSLTVVAKCNDDVLGQVAFSTIQWSSSNPTVAAIEGAATGESVAVKAVGGGTALISYTATMTDVSGNSVGSPLTGSCSITVNDAKGTITPEINNITVIQDGEMTIKTTAAGFTPDKALAYTVTSSNTAVATATVDANGIVTLKGVAKGDAILNVTANYTGGTELTAATTAVVVKVVDKKTITLDFKEATIYLTIPMILNAQITNATTQDPITAVSSDASVATVTVNNRAVTITGLKEGSTIITVQYVENGEEVKENCVVKVEKHPKDDKVTKLLDASKNQLYVLENDVYREAVAADYYTAAKFYIKGDAKYTGWQTIDGKVYYFTAAGDKVTGEQVIQGAKYNFASDGTLVTGTGTMGIDVSKWNGTIDWNAVKNSGVNYVIIRCGYRGSSQGMLIEDPKFATNIKGATAAGLKVGVYFFTQAIDEVEAVYEASYVLDKIKNYKISYPVFLDVEKSGGRGDAIDKATRTAVCKAFCQTIQNAGYTAGIYANKTWLTDKIDASALNSYKIWLAQYASTPTYTGKYDIWQYKSTGKVSGISGNVDLNLSYLGY